MNLSYRVDVSSFDSFHEIVMSKNTLVLENIYSKYHRMYSTSGSNELLETCQFNVFTDLLDEAEIVNPPMPLKNPNF